MNYEETKKLIEPFYASLDNEWPYAMKYTFSKLSDDKETAKAKEVFIISTSPNMFYNFTNALAEHTMNYCRTHHLSTTRLYNRSVLFNGDGLDSFGFATKIDISPMRKMLIVTNDRDSLKDASKLGLDATQETLCKRKGAGVIYKRTDVDVACVTNEEDRQHTYNTTVHKSSDYEEAKDKLDMFISTGNELVDSIFDFYKDNN